MGTRLILILGGARSGKSIHAEKLATDLAGTQRGVLYVATAQPLDEEMARRIVRHRQSRPATWRTLEEPLHLGAAITAALAVQPSPPGEATLVGDRPAITRPRSQSPYHPPAVDGQAQTASSPPPPIGVVLVDCITLWLSNLLFGPDHHPDAPIDEDAAEAVARTAVGELIAAHRQGGANTIMVSNEVGMGLVPPYPMGRLYRDLLGRVNAWLAAAADEVYLLVAGIPLRIKP